MIETEGQRRWWFATHPEYSRSQSGRKRRSEKEKNDDAIDPRDVDEHVDNRLKYETDESAIALLKSFKQDFGAQAYPNDHNEIGDNRGIDRRSNQPKKPEAIIRAPNPPGLTDHARSVLDFLVPGISKAYDRWRNGYYEAYPWAPGPLYDALGDLMNLAFAGLTRMQMAVAKTVNTTELAALKNARQELIEIWDWANFPRGGAIEDLLGRTLPRTFRSIDDFENGVAKSIKGMHLNMKTYLDPAKILSKGRGYVDDLADFDGATMGKIKITAEHITKRVLRIGVPTRGTEYQKRALRRVIKYGKQNRVKVEVFRLP